jgi:uncharacterized protein YwqG
MLDRAARDRIAAMFVEDGFDEDCAALIASMAEPGVRLIPSRVDPKALPIGASRFGGDPDVPPGFTWPERKGEKLTFLAQIALGEIQAPGLPTWGWLLVFYDFYDTPAGEVTDVGAVAVQHVTVPRSLLTRHRHPVGGETHEPFACCRLGSAPTIDVPDAFDEELELDEELHEDYEELASRISGVARHRPYHHLRGRPQLGHEGDMSSDCELLSRGLELYPEEDLTDFEERRRAQLAEEGRTRWTLLLQLDSDESEDADGATDPHAGPGFCFADAGRLYLWITKDDLAARRFDRVWPVWQC